MEIGSIILPAILTGIVNLVVAGAVGGSVKRWIDRRDVKLDDLEKEVVGLRDRRIKGVETQVVQQHDEANDRFKAAADSRKELYVRVAAIERDYVQAGVCRQTHHQLIEGQKDFLAAVINLAKVQERTENLARAISEMSERPIQLAQDLARIQERTETLAKTTGSVIERQMALAQDLATLEGRISGNH
jgi:hypothetical protein